MRSSWIGVGAMLSLVGCAPGGDVDSLDGTGSSADAACEAWAGTPSGVVFDDRQASAVIDMVDHATSAELDAVPGIGAATASAIIAARPFATGESPLSKLDAVSGVGATILTNLRDHADASWCALEDGRQSCCAAPSGGVVINEFSPGSAGWVELYNGGSVAVDLSGWLVDDVRPGGGKAVAIAPGTSIAPRGFVVVALGSINAGSADQVTLVDAGGAIVDQSANLYDPAAGSLASRCLARTTDGGAWSTSPLAASACTKGASNASSSSCAAVGGTYDGVTFTKEEECRAVDFLNFARFSEMRALPDRGRLVAYESGPEGVWAFQSSSWTRLSEYADFDKIGKTAVSAVKGASASWTQNGLPYDSVAATWAGRTGLVDGPIYFDKVFVTKMVPTSQNAECAELRDAPDATNFIVGCVPTYICWDGCWPSDAVGSFVSARGTMRHSSLPGGYQVTFNDEPRAPNPKLP